MPDPGGMLMLPGAGYLTLAGCSSLLLTHDGYSHRQA